MSDPISKTEGRSIKSSEGSSDNSDILAMRDEEGWEDAEPDVEENQFISLLDDEVFTDINSMLAHCKTKHKFDFLELRQRLGLDFYGSIKLVNLIRSRVHGGSQVSAETITKQDLEHDRFLKPVLEDDAVLFSLDELADMSEVTGSGNYQVKGKESADASEDLVTRISELEEELRRVQIQFENYRATVSETLDNRWHDKSTAGPSKTTAEEREGKRDDDSHYFTSYSYNDIHETMLKDTVRTDAYRDFIYNHKNLFAGKTVLDVGCGTGILSMFCAKAGAARVIAVDNSAIIDKARENVFTNGFADTITCLRGKIEEVVLPIDRVDIIISEWMGYCLLYEAMLDSVIWARDRYLRPDGLMVPSHMNMWIAPVADPDYVADHIAFWRDVYGFDMKAMQAGIFEDAQVLDMPASTLCGQPFPFLQFSLHATTVQDLSFKRAWRSKISQDIDALDGFIIWFDSFFMPSRDDAVPVDAKAEEWVKGEKRGVAFSTGPGGKITHWKQGVLLIDSVKGANAVRRKVGTEFLAEVEYTVPEDNSRALDIGMQWRFDGEEEVKRAQIWKMR